MERDSASRFLRLASTAANLAPPLKGVVDTVLEITTLVNRFKTCTSEWTEFRTYIEGAVATAIQSVESTKLEQSEAKVHVEKLLRTLKGLSERIRARQSEPIWAQLGHFRDHPIMIAEMRQQIDDVVGLFKLGTAIRTELKTEKLLQLAERQHAMDPLLGKLQYAKGASWDPSRICLHGTRQNIIESVLSWINTPRSATDKNIFLLTGVAGAGKSAIAHTVSQRLSKDKQLLTSFFFDREIAERNNPRCLVSTIATDLARRDSALAARIISAIQNDESLVGAPITRQFQDLILEPTERYECEYPLVIVLDALDEGCDVNLLKILSERAGELPDCIRIFLTSRMTPDMERLRRKSRVHSVSLDIYTEENSSDISIYVPYKLKQVAEEQLLGDDWPDALLVRSFQAKAGGLFLWVATTCDYLSTCYNAQRELELLVSASYHSGSSAESKMDNLYATILRACNWDSKEFAESCRTLLGAVVAAKSPLTLRALNALHQRVIMGSERALRQLSPLMTGLSNEPTGQPVRFLHLSLRDFLTLRAASSGAPAASHMFAVDEKGSSGMLALLCLDLVNKELDANIPGVGYCCNSDTQPSGVPSANGREIVEELMYACRFWLDHLVDVDAPVSSDLVWPLEHFLEHRATLWMELMAVYSRYEGLSRLHNWVQTGPLSHSALKTLAFSETLARMSRDLAQRLRYMDRREEALLAAKDEVAIYRAWEHRDSDNLAALARALSTSVRYLRELNQPDEAVTAASEAINIQRDLVLVNPAGSSADLAHSLYHLSTAYTDLGRPDDAIHAVEEAVRTQQSLPSEEQVTAMQKANLSLYLHGYSACFSRLGRHEDSLSTIVTAVELRRQLVKEHPSAYTFELASSLRLLAASFGSVGRYPEGLNIAEEAVELHRQLAKERPSVIGSLAHSLETLSYHLSCLGRDKEALEVTQESVEIRRSLAKERPAVFTSDLATALRNLSIDLNKLNLGGEALLVSQESVALSRQLAKERPAVYTSALADCLHSLSVDLSGHGRYEEALTTTQEAVELHRQLFVERPAVYTRDYAHSLHNLSCCLSNLNLFSEALTPSQQGVELLRQLAFERPDVFSSDLALSLYNLSFDLQSAERGEEALTAIKESVEIYRPLVKQYPSAHSSDFSDALARLAECLSEAGNEEAAADVRQEHESLDLGDSGS